MRTRTNCQIRPAVRDRASALGQAVGIGEGAGERWRDQPGHGRHGQCCAGPDREDLAQGVLRQRLRVDFREGGTGRGTGCGGRLGCSCGRNGNGAPIRHRGGGVEDGHRELPCVVTLKSRCDAAPERWMNLTVMTLWIGTPGARRRKASFLLPPGDEVASYFRRRATGAMPAEGPSTSASQLRAPGWGQTGAGLGSRPTRGRWEDSMQTYAIGAPGRDRPAARRPLPLSTGAAPPRHPELRRDRMGGRCGR